ncbi:MAG: phosphate ABC transporter substrate-binding protein [Anaerolineae bacterium]
MRGGVARVARLLFFLLVLATGGLGACGEPVATPEPVFLQVAGSTSMYQLASDLAAAYTEQSPLTDIEVLGQGTQFGLNELADGRADLALASWLPVDLDERWQATAIARDGIAIIVHQTNDVAGLGLLQLQDLFSGSVHEWAGVGGASAQGEVQVVSREAGSGTRDAFEALVMGERRVTPLAVVVPSSGAVVEYVATHPNAIGYVSMGMILPTVKVLSIEGEMPTPQTAQQGSYPLTRQLWLVAAASPTDSVVAFRRFALSPAGQQVVGQSLGRIR